MRNIYKSMKEIVAGTICILGIQFIGLTSAIIIFVMIVMLPSLFVAVDPATGTKVYVEMPKDFWTAIAIEIGAIMAVHVSVTAYLPRQHSWYAFCLALGPAPDSERVYKNESETVGEARKSLRPILIFGATIFVLILASNLINCYILDLM